MEEALYEVDAKTLAVKEIIRDGNLKEHPNKFGKGGKPVSQPKKSKLHGYHGKGFYSGLCKAFYSNNGVHHKNVEKDPTIKSGALAQWSPGDADWTPIRICQFTEITGPSGIYGSSEPTKDPVWALGWDPKSVILMLNDGGTWTSFRLPKTSHSYDGSHGWNTEWPRIREIGQKDYLMTIHGAFWRFPPTFRSADTSGIGMRSSYLKVIGDFCKWQDSLVFGCDVFYDFAFVNIIEVHNAYEYFPSGGLYSEKFTVVGSGQVPTYGNFVFLGNEVDNIPPGIAKALAHPAHKPQLTAAAKQWFGAGGSVKRGFLSLETWKPLLTLNYRQNMAVALKFTVALVFVVFMRRFPRARTLMFYLQKETNRKKRISARHNALFNLRFLRMEKVYRNR